MLRLMILLLLLLPLLGCRRDYRVVDKVDLNRFMGDWYVIAILPNPIEKNAVNGIESYALKPDGNIGITYTFYKGSPTGEKKVMHPKGKVYDKRSNAEWRVSFFPLIWFPYLIVDLADDYRYTAIGVPNRKYLWIMSREPSLSDTDYQAILTKLRGDGYAVDKIIKMRQEWQNAD